MPWALRGARWEPGEGDPAHESSECARCGEPLGDVRLVLVRHRGTHRIPDAFCSVDHLADWARSGGRYG